MSERKPWKLWQAVLAASTAFAILLLAPLLVAVLLVYFWHHPAQKTVEIVRYVTVADASAPTSEQSAPPNSAKSAAPPP